jgi:uncharacterized protein (TIGR00251 family)
VSRAGPVSATESGVRLRLRVQPRASRDEVAGVSGDAIRVRLTAPPVEGAANEALVRFLSAKLGVPRGAVVLCSGRTGRSKVVEVSGVSPGEASRRLGL